MSIEHEHYDNQGNYWTDDQPNPADAHPILDHQSVSEETNLHGWNADISKIPVDREVFALLDDKLRPSVIIPRYREAKRITWTEAQEGTVLTFDMPEGNFHACNGNAIKYWKEVDPPSSNVVVVADVVETIKTLDIRKEYKEFLLSLINKS